LKRVLERLHRSLHLPTTREPHIKVCNVTSTASYDRQQCLPLRRTSILSLFQPITSLATGCHPIVLGGLQSSGLPYVCKRNWHPANYIDACESRLPSCSRCHLILARVRLLVCVSLHLCAQPRNRLRSPVIPAHLHGVVRRAICSVTACSGCCAWKTMPHCGEQNWIAWMEMLRFVEDLTIRITNVVAPMKSHWGTDQGPRKIAILRVKESRDHM
jgi:hypothetical protein